MNKDFDVFTERDALRKLTGDDTVEVFVGSTEKMAGTIVVQYWRGNFYTAQHPTRKGVPFELGPILHKNYDRDKIAERLRKHKEGAVGWAS